MVGAFRPGLGGCGRAGASSREWSGRAGVALVARLMPRPRDEVGQVGDGAEDVGRAVPGQLLLVVRAGEDPGDDPGAGAYALSMSYEVSPATAIRRTSSTAAVRRKAASTMSG